MNASLNYRQNGNKIYQSLNNNLPVQIFHSRLNEAQNFYNLALQEAQNNVDKSSALKNLFVIYRRFQEFYSTREFNSEKHCFYIEMAQKYAFLASKHGENVQSSEWMAKIKLDATTLFKNSYQHLLNTFYKERVHFLLKLKTCSIDEVCALINFRICQCYFRIADDLMNSNLIQKALATNNECDFYYEESLKYFKENDQMIQMIKELKEDYILQRFTLEGLISKNIAQSLLDNCINKYEHLNIELIWEIIDWYKDASSKLKGNDVECEAEIASGIGFVYDEVLKIKDKAKNYYKLCWHLADSLRPKVLTHFKWYKRCANAIERYQQEILEEERNSIEAEKAKVYEKIKDNIQKLRKNANDGYYKFLPFIYSFYPPKNSKHTFSNNLTSANIKKSIQTAIYHYHPDKNSKKEFGNDWYFIADEITKILTNYYEKLKNED